MIVETNRTLWQIHGNLKNLKYILLMLDKLLRLNSSFIRSSVVLILNVTK